LVFLAFRDGKARFQTLNANHKDPWLPTVGAPPNNARLSRRPCGMVREAIGPARTSWTSEAPAPVGPPVLGFDECLVKKQVEKCCGGVKAPPLASAITTPSDFPPEPGRPRGASPVTSPPAHERLCTPVGGKAPMATLPPRSRAGVVCLTTRAAENALLLRLGAGGKQKAESL